jgi:Na+-driven multidrug efflux pump
VTAVAAMTVADVALDVVNVFAVKQGMLGMGLASSVSYYIAFFIGIGYFFKKSCMFRFRLALVRLKTCFALLRDGVPTVINQISLVLLVFVLNKILLDVGQNRAVAAYSVISTVGNICYCVGSGVASVALLLSSIFYSDEDRTELRALVKTMTLYTAVLNIVLIAAVLLAAPALVALFLADAPEAKDLAIKGLRLFSLSLLSSAVNTAYKNYLQGVGRMGFTQAISVMQNFVFTALFAFALSRFLSTTGVWIAFLCGETLTLLIIVLTVWKRAGKISFSAETFSYLPRDFGVAEGDCFEASARDIGEVVRVSGSATEFCLAHGESRRNSAMISLCIEEMANNIVSHGFTKDKKEHSLDVRVLFKGEKRVIRIRDNCINSDPVHYL